MKSEKLIFSNARHKYYIILLYARERTEEELLAIYCSIDETALLWDSLEDIVAEEGYEFTANERYIIESRQIVNRALIILSPPGRLYISDLESL